MNSKLAAFYLVVVAALWGLTFPLIETSVASLDPLIFVALRFTVAALPVLFYYVKHLDKACLKVGAALGVMHLGAFVFQTIGLQTVNASRAAFLTGIYVLMIPFLSPFLKMGRPTLHDVISALICCFGIYVLTGMDIGDFSVGDSWIILGDLFIAISVIYIGKHAQNNMDPYMLAYGQIVMTGLFSWV
ncbi:MAG: DMT family transporter, partial [Chlamydiia bacterium]|nr:DMT family transporter [Chlamydiia bacterium]